MGHPHPHPQLPKLIHPGQVQQPLLQVAAPLNDIQLVALLAATIVANTPGLSEAEAVAKAGRIVVESVKQNRAIGEAILESQQSLISQ
jgi:hypothetical protein